jgi:hypothetical protein
MLGAGGRKREMESAGANALLMNLIQTRLIVVSPLHANRKSALEWLVQAGRFVESTLGEQVEEEMAFLKALYLRDAEFLGLHMSNVLPINGPLPRDKKALVRVLEGRYAAFCGNPESVSSGTGTERTHPFATVS